MSEIIRMTAVEPVLYGVLKITWEDQYKAIVDLRPAISDIEVLEFMRNCPDRFNDVKLESCGHAIFWVDDNGDRIDFSTSLLRQQAIRQAEILRLAG